MEGVGAAPSGRRKWVMKFFALLIALLTPIPASAECAWVLWSEW
jgi:hypothetical protein